MTLHTNGFAQGVGAYTAFDVFNDTGMTAEGFEIDVQDVAPGDVTHTYPSPFSATPWVTRYGGATVSAYDFTARAPDAAHRFDAGHKGVLVTWAAAPANGAWLAAYGDQPSGTTISGNGTPFVGVYSLINGDSCYYYGLGGIYPTSGCDHFGLSFAAGATPGRMTYHWKIPDPTNRFLVNAAREASILPAPVLALLPHATPGAAPVVQAIARGPNDAGANPIRPQSAQATFGDAYWVLTITFYSTAESQLDNLQKGIFKHTRLAKYNRLSLLQRPPGIGANAAAPERAAVEDDIVDGNLVQVTKEYEYFQFSGAYDSVSHAALCGAYYATQADALSGGTPVQTGCQDSAGNVAQYFAAYWTIDPATGKPVFSPHGNTGHYFGTQYAAYNVK